VVLEVAVADDPNVSNGGGMGVDDSVVGMLQDQEEAVLVEEPPRRQWRYGGRSKHNFSRI
jgi:hypothetical protein